MCTLVAYVRCWPHLPLLVAANRDEYLARPSAEPAILAHAPWVFAGQDLSAGGTWLGINQHGLVAGVLNRYSADGPDPHRRSRGLLCLEVLHQPNRAAALGALSALDGHAYNSFHLLVADARGADVAINRADAMRIAPLGAGVHVLTNLAVDDAACPRIAKSAQRFRALATAGAGRDPAALIEPLREILADHSTALDPRAGPIDTLCVHRVGYGTRSASIIAVDGSRRTRYWHAPGPPCQASFSELRLPV